MKQTIGFWIGIALAVPLSIAANLLTSPTRLWLRAIRLNWHHRKTESIRNEYARMRELRRSRESLNALLMASLLQCISVASVAAIAFFLSFLIAWVSKMRSPSTAAVDLQNSFLLVVGVGMLIGIGGFAALSMLRTCVIALKMYYIVDVNFDSYEERVRIRLEAREKAGQREERAADVW